MASTKYSRAPGRPACKYGMECYQQQRAHWERFDHPITHPRLQDGASGSAGKRAREEEAHAEPAKAARVAAAASSSSRSAAASSSPSTAAQKAVLVFAPGAGGKTANDMVKLHQQLEQEEGLAVVRCDAQPMSWVTANAGHDKNVAHVISTANRAATAYPGAPILLCGSSFGNRVIAETLRTARAQLPKAVAHALICCGYPLNAPGKPEGADQKRPAHLLQLPAAVKVLMMQGTDDEFNGARGIAAVKELVGRMAADVELYEVPGGEHTLPKAKGPKARGLTQEQVHRMVRDKLKAFVASVC